VVNGDRFDRSEMSMDWRAQAKLEGYVSGRFNAIETLESVSK